MWLSFYFSSVPVRAVFVSVPVAAAPTPAVPVAAVFVSVPVPAPVAAAPADAVFVSDPVPVEVVSVPAAAVFAFVPVAVSDHLVDSGACCFPLSLPATSQTDLPPCPLRQSNLEIIIQRVFIGDSRSGF